MSNEVRIIGGVWRGRKLHFPAVSGLRPTPDRVRETLFNWLQGEVEGASCLDLYAGSGALGFEAASRGARRVVAVENQPTVCAALRRNCELLSARPMQILRCDAARYLTGPPQTFDIVFLDPPFRQGLIGPACELLESHGWLGPRALIYIEAESTLAPIPLPENWDLARSKKAGDVGYHLCRRCAH